MKTAVASMCTLVLLWVTTVTLVSDGVANATIFSDWEEEYILNANGYLIDRLDQKVDELKARLQKDVVDYNDVVKDIEANLNRVEGSGCKEGEFQCGGVGRQCFSELLVCDGVKDCHNGLDEDPYYCDVSKISAGASYSGWYVEGKCGKSPRSQLFCRMTITSVIRKNFFKPMIPLGVRSQCNFTRGEHGKPEIKSYKFKAIYQTANRRWRSEGNGYFADCFFTDKSFDVLRCDMFTGSLSKCGLGLLSYRDK